MDFSQLDRLLRDHATDLNLDNDERFELLELGARVDTERLRYLRNRAFDFARELIVADASDTLATLRWLEQMVKTLDLSALSKRCGRSFRC